MKTRFAMTADGYRRFLQVKSLPTYRIVGRSGEFPDEYAGRMGIAPHRSDAGEYAPTPGLWDYQEAISRVAIAKRKYAVFADCGLGKTLIFAEFAKHAMREIGPGKRVLIVSPLMVIAQTIAELKKFYGSEFPIVKVPAADLARWSSTVDQPPVIGITNYEALTNDVKGKMLGCLILDESSMLKSHYGKWGHHCLRLGSGLNWKLALSGTPAPNDRIEYANHAVFMDEYPNVNSFLAKFFINRGQTGERWELKKHAIKPFYRALSHWSIFLSSPSVYGWKDNASPLPPIHVHIHDVDLTKEQTEIAIGGNGRLFAGDPGGITGRSVLSQVAKGNHRGERIDTLKFKAIRDLVDSWPDESTIIWCHYNDEQDQVLKVFPEAASISGSTPDHTRASMIDDFKAGRTRVLISKPKILGFGLNLQVATRMVFSGLQDSYEEYYQCVKRANRYGASRPLNVHIPVTEIERPMIDTVLRKAQMVQRDTQEQESIFREASHVF